VVTDQQTYTNRQDRLQYTVPLSLACSVMKKSAQRRCKHCTLAVVKKIAPPQTRFPVARDGQNLISWRWSNLYLQTQFGEDRYTQFQVIVVTDPQTHTQTNPQTGPITIHCAAKLSVQCNEKVPRGDANTALWL